MFGEKEDRPESSKDSELEEDVKTPKAEETEENAGTVSGVGATKSGGFKKVESYSEPRSFMFCNYLHHPGLAGIQYKTFFHMCRLESISFDMESRSGSTFCLYDCLQSGVIGMLTIGVHRRASVGFMMDAITFL